MIDEPLLWKRWAIQWPAVPRHPQAVPDVRPFSTEKERDAWVAQNPGRREAVGVRNPYVKAWRTRREQEMKR